MSCQSCAITGPRGQEGGRRSTAAEPREAVERLRPIQARSSPRAADFLDARRPRPGNHVATPNLSRPLQAYSRAMLPMLPMVPLFAALRMRGGNVTASSACLVPGGWENG